MSDNPNRSAFEPLIRSGSAKTPPRHAFRFGTDETYSLDNPPSSTLHIGVTSPASASAVNLRAAGPETESHRFLMQRYLGRAYAAPLSIYLWTILQAVCVALALILVLGLISLAQNLWLDLNYSFLPPTKGQFNWIYITAMGGFMAGLFLLIPGAPAVGGHASLTQMMVFLETSSSESIPVLLSTSVVLICGAPLGPEVVLATIATCLSGFLAQRSINTRSRAVLLQNSLAAGFGAVFPTGLLIPPLLIHELAVTGRPDKLTVDSVIADEVMENESEGQRTGIELRPQNHDHLEGLSQQFLSATIVACLATLIAPSVAPLASFSPTSDREVEPWHYGAAVLMGILCGLAGILVLFLYAVACVVRRKTSKWLRSRGVPGWVTMMMFTTLAGVIHGLLAVWCPYSATMGLQFIRETWEAALDHDTILSAREFAFTAIARIVGLAAIIGCGFIGGAILPMAVIGGCMGFFLCLSMRWIPMTLAVSCCLAACPVSLCPLPLTATVAVSLMLGCSIEQSTLVFIACLASWMLIGGMGIVRFVGEWTIGVEGALEDDESVNNRPSDDDIIRNIRDTIFSGS